MREPSALRITEEELVGNAIVEHKDPQRKAAQGIMNKCPFCKSSAVVLADFTRQCPGIGGVFNASGQAWVSCTKCEAEGPVCSTTKEAIRMWNEAKR